MSARVSTWSDDVNNTRASGQCYVPKVSEGGHSRARLVTRVDWKILEECAYRDLNVRETVLDTTIGFVLQWPQPEQRRTSVDPHVAIKEAAAKRHRANKLA